MGQLLEDIEQGNVSVDAVKQLRAVLSREALTSRSISYVHVIRILASALYRCSSEEACEDTIPMLRSILDFTDQDAVSALGDLEAFSRKLLSFFHKGKLATRVDIAHLLSGIAKASQNRQVLISIGKIPGAVEGLTQFLKDDVSQETAGATLDTLLILCCRCKRTRLRAVEAGGVARVVEALPKAEREVCEKALSLLQLLLSCGEGRCAAIDHRLAIPAITKKLLRVSEMATDLAIAAIWTICEHSAGSSEVRHEITQAGGVGKLIVILQVSPRPKTKQRAGQLIKLLESTHN